MGLFNEKNYKLIEWPKMQNEIFFSFLGISTFGEGAGVKPVGTKSQLRPNFYSEGSPKEKEEIVVTIKANLIFWTNIGG